MAGYYWIKEKYNFSNEEAAVVEWQFRYTGDFKSAVWNAIKLADEGNLKLLAKSFPVEVEGYKRYTREEGWWQKVEGILERKNMERKAGGL